MNKVTISLKNCYGINKLNTTEISFAKSKANVIYAKNGLMKTSFTKIFKKIQEGKKKDIKDEIFGNVPVEVEIKVDNIDIDKDEVFVIKSFESSYESSSIASLLINDDLKMKLEEVLQLRTNFLKILEEKSRLKVSKTSLGKIIYELENQIIEDFNLLDKSILQNLENFEIEQLNYDFSLIKYSDIFDDGVLKKIKTDNFQEKIKEYLNKSNEIYSGYSFLDKGVFTLPKLKEVSKRLKANNFFVKENKIILDGNIENLNLKELEKKIKEIESHLKDSAEFKEIENLLSDIKGIALKDTIETHPEIIDELKLDNLDNFRKKLWHSYIKSEIENFELLKTKYIELKAEIENLNIDETPWKEAINIFNNRFTLPFRMEVENLRSSIIGESVPKIVFSFCKDGNIENDSDKNWKKLNRDELEKTDTLSQGEKRALYLLNIIFDIEKRKRENLKTLFIIDDIADSFDYKNKYAIVEYLREISKTDNFFMIILSHNFDFFRTISSRLVIDRENKLHAIKTNDEIKLIQEYYQDKPFIAWKDNLKQNKKYCLIDVKKHILALIPFVRNLIEYGEDRNKNDLSIKNDYLFLTNLLHLKGKTKDINIGNLKIIYKEYLFRDDFDSNIKDDEKIYEMIIDVADTIVEDDRLENKIIIAIAIRLLAEEYMQKEIENAQNIFVWKETTGKGKSKKTISKSSNGIEYLEFVSSQNNQTMTLFNGFIQIGENENRKTLESVNIMTPENIHLNSFMYEPILDMDIVELKNLYEKVKEMV